MFFLCYNFARIEVGFMKKSNKGFTLVEVLVVITIMGLILLFALPEVQRLQARNMDRKYRTYEQSLESSARLFVDSNAIDLFGTSENGCADVSFAELKAKSLAKEYVGDGVSCNNKNTYVHIQRVNNKDTYKVFLNCTKNGEIVYRTDKNRVKCDASGDSNKVITLGNFKITMKPDKTDWSKTKNVKIEIESSDKLVSNISLKYYVSEDDDGDSVVPGSEGTIEFGNNSGVTKVSRSVALADMTGFRYLVINPTTIKDLKGRVYSEKTISGALKMDNTPPVINDIRMESDFNGTRVWINFTDEESGVKEFKYIFPEREETRATLLTGKFNSPTSPNLFLSDNFTDESLDDQILIRAYDNAGNLTEKTSHIKVYKNKLDISNLKMVIVDKDGNDAMPYKMPYYDSDGNLVGETITNNWHNYLKIESITGATNTAGDIIYQVNGKTFDPNKGMIINEEAVYRGLTIKVISRFGETTSTAEKTYEYYYDGKKPFINIGKTSSGAVTIRAVDDGAGLSSCSGTYSFKPIYHPSYSNGEPSSGSISLVGARDRLTISPKSRGIYQFRASVNCRDKVGNVSSRTSMFQVTY